MKNKLLLLISFVLISFSCFAQLSEDKKYADQFGVLASPSLQYLFQNKALPIGLIYKFQVKPDQAWRASVQGFLRKKVEPDFDAGEAGTLKVQSTDAFFQTLGGYEWQNSLNKNWTLYYGADAGLNYLKFGFDIKANDKQAFEKAGYTFGYMNSNRAGVLVQPLAGLRFKIHPRIYMATETKISLSADRLEDNLINSMIDPEGQPKRVELSQISYLYNLKYVPLSNIQLLYQF